MEDRDELIDVLERIKATIFEVQTQFSEAADLVNRKRTNDITEMPRDRESVNYINRQEEESLTEYDRIIKDGECLMDIITDAQATFLNAVKIVSKKSYFDLAEEQTVKVQREINQAIIDIITYNDLLRRLIYIDLLRRIY
jgi:hypothetical protein